MCVWVCVHMWVVLWHVRWHLALGLITPTEGFALTLVNLCNNKLQQREKLMSRICLGLSVSTWLKHAYLLYVCVCLYMSECYCVLISLAQLWLPTHPLIKLWEYIIKVSRICLQINHAWGRWTKNNMHVCIYSAR